MWLAAMRSISQVVPGLRWGYAARNPPYLLVAVGSQEWLDVGCFRPLRR